MSTEPRPAMQLRRLADCWDHLRIPLNAEERHQRPGVVPYWGANAVQGFVDEALVDEEVVLLGEDGAPFFDRNRDVAFYVNEPIWPNNHIHVLKPHPATDARWLTYALNAVDYRLYVGGSTRDKLTQSALMQIQIPTPSPAEQRLIAEYLDRETARIQTLIEEQQRLVLLIVERSEAEADALLSAPTEARHTTVKRVLRPLSRPAVEGLGVVTAFRDGVVTLRSNRREDGYTFSNTEHGYQEIRAGDFVFHALDGFAGAVGVSDSHGNATPVYHVCEALAGDHLPYIALMLRYLGRSGFLATQAPNVRERSVDFRNWSMFGRLPLALPSVTDQRCVATRLAERAAMVNMLVEEARRLIDLSRERRSALISAAITGQIDVRAVA